MADGVVVNYEQRGSGSPLVLLHGIGHRWQAWEPVLDALAARHEVIALDLPGFGRSPAMNGGYGMPVAMERLRAIFAHLRLDRPHIAGNSLGGVLAIEAAAQGLVASTTALSPAGFWSRADRARARAGLRLIASSAHAPAAVSRTVLAKRPLRATALGLLYAHPSRISQQTAYEDMVALRDSAGFAPTLAEAKHYLWAGTAPTVPVTIAWGARDRLLPPRQARRAAALLPGASHVLLPGCGHVPMIDNPSLVARTILDTCAAADRDAAGADRTDTGADQAS